MVTGASLSIILISFCRENAFALLNVCCPQFSICAIQFSVLIKDKMTGQYMLCLCVFLSSQKTVKMSGCLWNYFSVLTMNISGTIDSAKVEHEHEDLLDNCSHKLRHLFSETENVSQPARETLSERETFKH